MISNTPTNPPIQGLLTSTVAIPSPIDLRIDSRDKPLQVGLSVVKTAGRKRPVRPPAPINAQPLTTVSEPSKAKRKEMEEETEEEPAIQSTAKKSPYSFSFSTIPEARCFARTIVTRNTNKSRIYIQRVFVKWPAAWARDKDICRWEKI